MAYTNCPFTSSWRTQSSLLGPGICWLADCSSCCQVDHPSKISRKKARVPWVRTRGGFALTSVASSSQDLFLLLWIMAASRKETGLMKWKLSGRTYKTSYRPSPHCPSQFSPRPQCSKNTQLSCHKSLLDRLEPSQMYKYWGTVSRQQCLPPLFSGEEKEFSKRKKPAPQPWNFITEPGKKLGLWPLKNFCGNPILPLPALWL